MSPSAITSVRRALLLRSALLASLSGLVLAAGVVVVTTQTVSAATLTTTAKLASGELASTSNCPKGTAPGITSHQVTVAATIVNISGGSLSNSTFGVPSAAAQQEDWNLVAKSINKAGGAGCRQIEMQFYDVNPVNASAAQQTCLNIAAAHPYMVLDSGVLTEIGASNCLPAHQVPLASGYLTEEQLNQYHPYYLQIGDIPEDIINNGILGMKQLGLFSPSKGFRKIGVLYHTCSTALVTAEQKALHAAGVTGKAVTSYSLGCPVSGVDTPAAMEQAVLNFKSAGVSDVMMLEITDGGLFTQVAEQQNYKPQYLFAENDTAVNSTPSANAPNPANYNGAIDVLGGAYGEQSTPGYKPSGGTKACNAIYSAAGQKPVYSQTTGYPGVVCDYLWFVQALLSHASSVAPSAFPHDMRAMGTVEFSYPFAPVDFASAPSASTYGISFWRAAEFHESCKCWQVSSAEFHAPFK